VSESQNKDVSKRRAIIYQSLYLSNLLLVPGLSFAALLWLFVKHKQFKGLSKIHLYRAFQLSVAAGIFIIIIPLLIILLSNAFEASIMVMLVYFVTIHAAFVMIGMFNIARAMAGKLPYF